MAHNISLFVLWTQSISVLLIQQYKYWQRCNLKSRNVKKRTFRNVRPAKIQIRLRIRAVWSESSWAHFG